MVLGTLLGFGDDGAPLVDFPGNRDDDPVVARTTALLRPDDIGSQVALLFESGDSAKPVVVGVVLRPAGVPAQRVSVEHAGERIEFTAEREIVIRCGKSSITLTRAGKIILRGEYVLSHSSGVNKIKGATVHIN